MTIEATSGFRAFKAPVSAFEAAVPSITSPKAVNDTPWSPRARLGFILLSGALAWVAVIVGVVEVTRLVANTLL